MKLCTNGKRNAYHWHFKKALSNFIRMKLLEEPETATIQVLCTKARHKLILRELCPVDDWSRDGFIEMNNDHSEKLLSVLTKMCENQNLLEDKMNALTEKVTTVQNGQNDNQNHYNNYKNNRGRGNYCGRNNNDRGVIEEDIIKTIMEMDDTEITTIEEITEAEVIGEETIEEISPITFLTIITEIVIRMMKLQ